MKKVVFLAEMVLTRKMVTAILVHLTVRNALIQLNAYLAATDTTYHQITVKLVLRGVRSV